MGGSASCLEWQFKNKIKSLVSNSGEKKNPIVWFSSGQKQSILRHVEKIAKCYHKYNAIIGMIAVCPV